MTNTRLGSFFAVALCASCSREEAPREPAAAPRALPPAVASSATAAASAESVPAPSAAEPAEPGAWVESTQYKLRVMKFARCRSGTPGPLKLAVSIEVEARVEGVVASARDLVWEREGVILQSLVEPKPELGCGPLLKAKELKPGEVARGAVVFELPDESFGRAAFLAFQPTRWGGAPRVRVKVPECLDRCGDAGLPATKQP